MLGDLAGCQPAEVRQLQYLTHGRFYLTERAAHDHAVERLGRTVESELVRFGRIFQRTRAPHLGTAEPVERARAQPHDQPGVERTLEGVVLAGVLPGFQKHVVKKILGLALGAEHAYRERKKARRVAIVDHGHGLGVPTLDTKSELAVLVHRHRRAALGLRR